MENKLISAPRYKIALIVPYIGPLPPYFPVWLESAKANSDVDFFFYTDQDVEIDAPNFHVTKTTLEKLRERFERAVKRPVSLPFAYKLCDYKVAYGLFFEEELRGYDFWGYCDIDLVFGRIRRFLTDEVLSSYDRFYAYGPFCLYRNNEKMRRAFELPGSWFTLDEMFGPVHIGADEFCGINRICLKNGIPWYTNIDFANLDRHFKKRLEIGRKQPNYPVQAFYWLDGRAFQRYVNGEQTQERELLYIHWIKRRPVPEGLPLPGEAVVITSEKLCVCSPEDLTPENMRRWNPSACMGERFFNRQKQRVRRCWLLFTGTFTYKKIWSKRICFWILETGLKKLPYP